MESINSDKWRVRLSIVAIFLLGFIAGGLAVNLYRPGRANSGDIRPPSGFHRGGGIEWVIKSLNLDDQQKQQVDQILSDTRQRLQEVHRASAPQLAEIRKQTQDQLKKVLTEDQWNRFQQAIKEHEERLDRGDRGDRPHRRPFFQDPSQSPTPSPQ